MKLRALKAFRIGGVTYARGGEVVLAERAGRDLVERGFAEEVKPAKAEEKPEADNKTRRKRSGDE